ncbi:phosphatidylinositol 3,4,5-trisphosphate 3-phosphatase and protein-tyrosine-phosphatase PTEN1 isoform X2 [Asparagus officinalis]|uniref:phosphatidylinositol 3,4,5-trisphosphate 3-phosphatase and protein-tyrosine-phosphatase PTEN1 isoform X2 n=1 Tax=Asparagus officinalis TaxID=4686 RepID=UPI00098E767D|nr:phosphatidylinositol 3,4,5-trisphosphate 3-phosphatase and protein-tyrosine-phosphatase PTEN1 isoform X2 [Asparagus officinalis]
MGTKISKQGPAKVKIMGDINVQHKVVHYLTSLFFVRSLVSKSRRRMIVAGYDLDMTYITDRLLAMSYPAERMQAMYRNPLWQVKNVLDMRHPGHYKVYNLCAEESYDASHFHGRVEVYPFDDNHVPPLKMIKLLCESIHSWLSQDPENVAVIHCKGRTGLMVCAYLVYSGMSADEALQLYAAKRTTNNQGVSIPSQRRYVGYWSSILKIPRENLDGPPVVELPKPTTRELRRIRLYDTVNTDSIFFVVTKSLEAEEVPDQLYQPSVEVVKGCCRQVKQACQITDSPRYYMSCVDNDSDQSNNGRETTRFLVQMDTERSSIYQKTCLDYYFENPLQVAGDLRVIFYEKMFGGRLFYTCFNTAFIENILLQFSVRDLDKVGGKGRSICGSTFCLELLFGPTNPVEY